MREATAEITAERLEWKKHLKLDDLYRVPAETKAVVMNIVEQTKRRSGWGAYRTLAAWCATQRPLRMESPRLPTGLDGEAVSRVRSTVRGSHGNRRVLPVKIVWIGAWSFSCDARVAQYWA
jgi:hypothetical protein